MTAPKKMSAYIRVSQVRGRKGESFISPDQQREAIQRWATAHGVELEGEYEDLDQSGGKMRRPAFDRMMAAIEGGRSDGVIVAKIDRFARSLIGALKALEHMDKLGASFVSVADSFDTSTPTGRLMLRIMLSLAEFELERIRDNWDDSTARAIARGIHFTNSVPLGYQRREDGRLEPDPRTAPIVEEMFRRRIARQSWRAIAAWLTETLPREDGRAWTSRNVATMIQSPTYKGEAFHGDHRNSDAHKAIVTIPEWDAANSVSGGPGAVKQSSALLAGLIRCAGCRYAMRRTMITYTLASGEKRKVATYSCQRKHTGGDCPAPAHVMASTIEPIVIRHFAWWHFHSERAGASPDLDAVREAERQLADAERRLADVMADDALREAAPEAHLADVKRRQAIVTEAREALEAARAQVQIDESRPMLLADEWDALDTEARRELLRASLDAVYIRKGHAQRDDVEERVWLRWRGEDDLERPERGNGRYQTKSVPWPVEGKPSEVAIPEALAAKGVRGFTGPSMALANVPRWVLESGLDIPEEITASLATVASSQ